MVMNNYLILILGQMKYYSENSHDRPQNFGETCVIYPKLINMEKKYVLGQFFLVTVVFLMLCKKIVMAES